MRISMFIYVVQVTRQTLKMAVYKMFVENLHMNELIYIYMTIFCVPTGDHVGQRMELEVKRMGFDTQNIWRVSDINSNYKYVSLASL